MSLITRTYTFIDGTTAYGSQVESEVANIVNTLNNLNSASTKWDIVSVLSASSVPLVVDNSSGSQDVADFKANGVTKVYISSTGVLNAVNTLAMNSTKITGLATGTAATDAATVGQAIYKTAPAQQITTSATATASGTYVSTNSTNSITPSSASSRVKITISGQVLMSSTSTVAQVTLFRGAVDLATTVGDGFVKIITPTSANMQVPVSITFIDSPATTSSTTYTVKILSSDASHTVTWINACQGTLILEEIA